ncbi:MAG: sigma 54-interacting transcriptional regulator [Isosphaeraceae bacterium]
MTRPRGSGVRRLQQSFQKAALPIYLLDRSACLAFVNDAWEELTGRDAKSVARLPCRRLDARAADPILAALADDLAPPSEAWSGTPCSSRAGITHRDGTRRFRLLEFWPLPDRRGSLLGILGFIRPIVDEPAAPAAESQCLRAELLELREQLQQRFGFDHLIGKGDAHRRLIDQVRAASATDLDLLIVGEVGTGKRLVARTIHQGGARSNSPLIPFDCAALPADVLGRELHEGVATWPPGTTLLIGDILDLPRDHQETLAGALEGPIRLLATSTGDPDRALAEGSLRPDLYYRFTAMILRLRPLRDRLEELPLIAQHMLERANRRSEAQRAGFTAAALAVLGSYDWPGNLRELERTIERAHSSATGELIDADDIPAAIRGNLGAAYYPPASVQLITPLDAILEQVERRLIEQALQKARYNKSKAAELLAISRPRLYRRITELRIPELVEPSPADFDP